MTKVEALDALASMASDVRNARLERDDLILESRRLGATQSEIARAAGISVEGVRKALLRLGHREEA